MALSLGERSKSHRVDMLREDRDVLVIWTSRQERKASGTKYLPVLLMVSWWILWNTSFVSNRKPVYCHASCQFLIRVIAVAWLLWNARKSLKSNRVTKRFLFLNLFNDVFSGILLSFLWRYSPNLGLGLPTWNSPFHFGFLELGQSVGILGRVISSSQGLSNFT
jgi:hypothetical protein